MNQTQRTYIKQRVSGILNTKAGQLREKLTKKPKTLTNLERVDMIRAGKVKMFPYSKLKSNLTGQYGCQVDMVYDFSKYITRGGIDQKKYNAGFAKLQKKANEIIDKVMLGDAEEALKMILEFESIEV